MSRHFDWARAKQIERDKLAPPAITPPGGMGSPASPAQLAYLHRLDPSIPEERLKALDRWEASAAISRLMRGRSS
jgi:hypothetical protein